MDKQKVTDLARSFSESCKKVVKDKQFIQKHASPAVMLVALTVVQILGMDGGKRGGWMGMD